MSSAGRLLAASLHFYCLSFRLRGDDERQGASRASRHRPHWTPPRLRGAGSARGSLASRVCTSTGAGPLRPRASVPQAARHVAHVLATRPNSTPNNSSFSSTRGTSCSTHVSNQPLSDGTRPGSLRSRHRSDTTPRSRYRHARSQARDTRPPYPPPGGHWPHPCTSIACHSRLRGDDERQGASRASRPRLHWMTSFAV